jgi:hypothetical protein
MDAVEDYARRWIKREVDQDPELESLSDWVRTIRSLVQGRIHKLKNCGAVTSQRVLKVLFYVNILQCLFVVEHFTANAVSVAIGDNGNRLILKYGGISARRWIKREVDQDPELESLSDWVRTIRSLVQGRIHKLKNCVNSRPKSVFNDPFVEQVDDPAMYLYLYGVLLSLDVQYK